MNGRHEGLWERANHPCNPTARNIISGHRKVRSRRFSKILYRSLFTSRHPATLALDPRRRTPRPVRSILPLGHYPLEPHPLATPKQHLSIVEGFREPDREVPKHPQHLLQLPPPLDQRKRPQILPVERQQIERPYLQVLGRIPTEGQILEVGTSGTIANQLPIDDRIPPQ